MSDADPALRYVKPASGVTVIDPYASAPIPPHGKGLAWNSFWQRRLDQGDVVDTTADEIAAAEAEIAAAAKKAAETALAAERRAAKSTGDDK